MALNIKKDHDRREIGLMPGHLSSVRGFSKISSLLPRSLIALTICAGLWSVAFAELDAAPADQKDNAGARKDAELASKMNPKDMQARNTLAMAAYDAGNAKRALAILGGTIAMYPGNPEAYWIRAEYRFRRGDFQGAISDDKVLLNWGNRKSFIYKNIAQGLMALDKPSDAVPYLNEAIELDPKDAQAYFLRGKARFWIRGHNDEVLADLKSAAELDNTSHYKVIYTVVEEWFAQGWFPSPSGSKIAISQSKT